MGRNIFLFLLFLFIPIPSFPGGDIFFHKINVEQGLSQFSIRTIYQDEFGTLWFGTREGVNRYNGNSIEVIYPTLNDSNTPDNLIYNICGDKNGSVFIHSQSGVTRYDLRTSTINEIVGESVGAICYGADNLWIGEDNALFCYRDGHKDLYAEFRDIASPITSLLETAEGTIYAGTLSSGVYAIGSDNIQRCVLSGCSEVSSIFEDGGRNIWIATTQRGVYKATPEGGVINYRANSVLKANAPCSNYIRTICQDNDGCIWIGTDKGLDKLDPSDGTFSHYNAEGNTPLFLSNESVWSLLKDSQGSIWVGTYFGGVNYFNPEMSFFTYHDLQNGYFRNRPFPIISNIIEHDRQSIFLCTEGSGLVHYNLKDKTYKVFLAEKNNPRSLSSNNIKAAYYDKVRRELWLGTHLGGVCMLDTRSWTFTRMPHIKSDLQIANNIHTIIPYRDDLLVATQNGLFILDRAKRQFKLFSRQLHEVASFIHDIKIDGNGRLWVATINGVYKYDLASGTIQSYHYDICDASSLSNNNATKIFIDSRNNIWIATSGGGIDLYREDSGSFLRYTKKHSGLLNDNVSNILESPLGHLVISTTKGLSIFDTGKDKIYNFGPDNEFPLNSLYNGGMNISSGGELYIAGMNGLVSFFEENLFIPEKRFELNLVSLKINNTEVVPGDQSGILSKSLLYTDAINLNHRQKNITLEFASDNYIQSRYPVYRYKLNHSSYWTTLPADVKQLNFVNLSPGRYDLLVEGLSQANEQVVASKSLKITISPPIHNTWYAYIIYVAVILLVIWRYSKFAQSKLLLKNSLENEKREKEQLEDINQSKLRFFTNISHEFRTPLTLISGQVDMLLQKQEIPPSVYSSILSIKRNTHSMQKLINELLEFRKIDQGFLKLKVSRYNFIDFISELHLSFVEYAKYKKITFNIDCQNKSIELWFDPVQLQKVFSNLYLNAFKYTPQGGFINTVVRECDNCVIIQITDSGIGMSADDIEKIFDRFFQADNGLLQGKNFTGTGIGLALTKNILDLHSAGIAVDSQLQLGSRFTVTLRKGMEHFPADQITETPDTDAVIIDDIGKLSDDDTAQVSVWPKSTGEKYTMLIVEDNPELCSMLKKIFEPLYTVYTAHDGNEGLKLTMEHMPDIVLSDLMLPGMSGAEMCSKIKKNFTTCHIPIVLLTAQTAIESSIEGFLLGADDYVTKPFNVKALIARCNNLVNSRRVLQEKFSGDAKSASKQIATNHKDEMFLDKAYRIIEKFLDDNEFDVLAFSREMKLGRTKLFHRIKGITGQTPNEFIVSVRLKKAAVMLNSVSELSISEISYKVGFSSPKYFSRCFRKHFGISPSEFREGKSPAS